MHERMIVVTTLHLVKYIYENVMELFYDRYDMNGPRDKEAGAVEKKQVGKKKQGSLSKSKQAVT